MTDERDGEWGEAEGGDERWDAVVHELRRPARARPEAIGALLAEVRAAPSPARAAVGRWTRWVGVAAAAAVVGVALFRSGHVAPVERGDTVQLAAARNGAGVVPANGVQLRQFVFRVAGASSVVLVGDFNSWDAGALPLARSGDEWRVTVALPPGRFRYAFVVDGTRWVADAAAPLAPDDEFGTPSSVILVGES
jgi:hypothetical protein